MSEIGPILTACNESLAAANLTERDAGAVALAGRYAALMDRPTVPAKYRHALSQIGMALDGQATDAFTLIAAALSEQSVASDIGPKLLAVLSSLGCTLAARGEKGTESTRDVDPARVALDELKARRATRAHRAATLDSAAP